MTLPLLRRSGLVPGHILLRYKRFLADVELEDGSRVTAHCTNTGTMATCWEPGDPVLLEPSANPNRKLPFTWIACSTTCSTRGTQSELRERAVPLDQGRRSGQAWPGHAVGSARGTQSEPRERAVPLDQGRRSGQAWPGHAVGSTRGTQSELRERAVPLVYNWVGVDTGVPNKVVAEAVRQDRLPGLPGLSEVRTEVTYGVERSRIDVLARDAEGRSVYIEVKNTTLRIGDQICFPDAVTERGRKHLRELQGMVREGHRAALVFFVQRGDGLSFDAARGIDPAYAAELDRAAEAGVEILPLQVHLEARPEADGTWSLEWGLAGVLPWVRLKS